MRNIIVGTAGHIDHGKTTLIKALTGRETDRLKAEKERGISIELGFTWFDLPSGRRAGIVDVPGHERFIKNMLAGVGGIDVVILVIAADEGVMPQTKEHLNILNLLKVKKGIIALTKKDMVEQDWLELVAEQIREEVRGSFLKDAKIIPVSSTKGDGLSELIGEIDEITASVEAKSSEGIFRLPIDRVFTIAGFGTVVTGTLLSGTINEGDKVHILPQGIETRIRSVQVHEKSVKAAFAGQRVALNLANVKVEDIERGNILAEPDSIVPTMMLDAKLEMLKDAERSIDNRDRLRLYHGTAEIMCRVVLLDREELRPGQSAFVQLRLEEQLACQKDDRFVIRTYSPMLTVAGGIILDSNPPKRKRFKEEVIEELKIKEQGEPADIIEQYILKHSSSFLDKKEVQKMTGNLSDESFAKLIRVLEEKQAIISLKTGDETYFFHSQYLKELGNKLSDVLDAYHKKNPLKPGISKEEVKSRLWDKAKPKLSELIFQYYENAKLIKLENQFAGLYHFKVEFNRLQLQVKDYILSRFSQSSFNPPKLSELIAEKKHSEGQLRMVYTALIEMGQLVKVDEDTAFIKEAYERAAAQASGYIHENGAITLGQFRDLLGTSRKYAVALLDHFDQIKLTKRIEDKRVLF